MIDVGGVSGGYQVNVKTEAGEAASTTRPVPATVDTEIPSAAGIPVASASELPPSQAPIDYGLAISAVGTMSENVGVDFGRIAALMMMIDAELSRAARDSQVDQIEEVAAQMHKSADDLRASAKMALVGGCVAGSMQIASAGITIAGGAKGMSLTSGPAAAAGEAPSAPLEESSTPTPEETSAPAASPQAELGPGVDEAAPAQGSAEESGEENVEEVTEQETKAKQKAATEDRDMVHSQQLSARAQNISLVTQGLSQVTSATGEIIKSALDYESKSKEAKSKDDDAMAEEQRAYLERTRAFAESMQKGAQDMIQVYQQMTDSMYQTSSQVWSRA